MKITCPNCREVIAAEDIDRASGRAWCYRWDDCSLDREGCFR